MAMNTGSIISNVYAQNYAASSKEVTKAAKQNSSEEMKEVTAKETKDLGRTIGEPKLSKEAQMYYDKLKKKFANYDFILVSKDQKANAQANAAKYANNFKTVVLIDEEKIEKMATDESYRKKYEGILSGAATQLEQLKTGLEKTGAKVNGFGMQVNDDGTVSYFAYLKKSSADQKARIDKTAAKKKVEKKEAEKKAEKKKEQERLEKNKNSKLEKESEIKTDNPENITISADSIEELIRKVSEFAFTERSNNVQTDYEKIIGQHVDFKW